MSRPSTRTSPEVGRSRPPKICSNVVFPEPDAPTMAIRSAGATARLTPRSTSSVSGPWRKLLQTPEATNTGSIMAQCLRRCRARRAPRRVHRREHAQQEGDRADAQHVNAFDVCGQLAHEIHPRIEKLRVQHALQRVDEHLQIARYQNAERGTTERAGKSDQYTLHGESAENVARACPQSAQQRDIGLLLLHDHHQGCDDVE